MPKVLSALALTILVSNAPALAGDCKVDFEKTVVYLQKDVESPETVQLFLGKGARVVTETAATADMLRLKKDSYDACKDDRCQIDLGQAVSASHMASKASATTIYVWDLKSEAIVCTLVLPSPAIEHQGVAGDPSPKQIIDGTLLAKGMSVEDVLRLVGKPESKSDSFVCVYSLFFSRNRICKKDYGGKHGFCHLRFDAENRLLSCLKTEFGICSFSMTSG